MPFTTPDWPLPLLAAAAANGNGQGGAASTLLQYIHDGGILSYVLIGLSVLALALIIRNALALRYTEFAPPQVMQALDTMLSEGRLAEVEKFCRTPGNQCFVTTVLGESFMRARASEFGLLEFRSAMEDVARGEADEVHRMNDILGVIAAIGPMLGLLGTVFGMIGAFRAIGALQGAARSNELAVFMSMALVNTAEGLMVAIPATIAFALFRRRIDRIMHRLGRDLERLAGLVSSGRPRGAAPGSASAPGTPGIAGAAAAGTPGSAGSAPGAAPGTRRG